jgi:uncharacterized membrane protein YdjX (TVP38/TMEM64 family)
MPLKVPVVCAGALGVPRRAFLGTLLAARLPRYLGLAWLGQQLGTDAFGWLRGHGWHVLAFAAFLAVALYALVWASDRLRK